MAKEVKKRWSRWTREFIELLLAEMQEAIVEDPEFRISHWEKARGIHRCSMRQYCERYGLLHKYLKAKTAYELKRAYRKKDERSEKVL